jgi:hypothetical protein
MSENLPGTPAPKPPDENQFLDMVEKSVYRQKAVKIGDLPPGAKLPEAPGTGAGGGPAKPPPDENQFLDMVEKSVYRQKAVKLDEVPGAAPSGKSSPKVTGPRPPAPAQGGGLPLPAVIGILAVVAIVAGGIAAFFLLQK